MRKWLGVLLLGAIIYLASTKFRLSNILYVSSCHLAYENDEYKVTALILENNNENDIILFSSITKTGKNEVYDDIKKYL